MFQFSLVKLILASNYFVFSCASAEMGAGSDPGFMTMPIRCRASCAALTLAFALLLPAAANAQNAYITNYNASTVSVIETATNTVTATIPVGRGPDGVAVTPGGAKAYIANQIDGTVSVIDTATNTVTATIPNTVGGYRPDGIAVSPDGAKVYVTGQNSSDSDNTVSVIATASNAVVARIPVGNIPIGVAVSPDGAKVYVTNQNSGSVSVIAAASNTVVATIPVGAFPFGVAVTPDGAQAMVANYGSGTVSVIATATNTVVATIPVGNGTWGVAVTPDGAKAYVTNRNSDTVSVIATASNTVVATIRVGNGPWGVAVTPNGADAYVANSNDNTVSVIATATNAVATTISGINQPLAFGKFIGGPVHGSPPVAVNETKTTRINSPVLVDFSAGASRNPTSAAIVSPPAHGTLGPISGTRVTFTPNHCYAGRDSFTFRLSNAFGPSNTATATITVAGTPTAANVAATTVQNVPVSINLAAGACGSPTSAARAGTPVGGTVTGFPATTVIFTPVTGFTGTASFQFTLANAFGPSTPATATITVARGLPPVAAPQNRTIRAGAAVTIDLSNNATGNPTSAAVVSRPAHGTLSPISGTRVTYTQTTCFLGTDKFTFTLSNPYGTSIVATATITIIPVNSPSTAVHLVDPYLLNRVTPDTNIDLTPLYRAQRWNDVQAKGLVADNTSAAIAVVQTTDCASDVSLSTTNGTTLADYSPDFLKKPPALGLPGLPISRTKLLNIGGSFFGAALVQAPLISGTYSLSTPSSANPITVTAFHGSRWAAAATMSLVIPPVVLVHGIWGDRTALQYYENNLNTYDFWKLYPTGFGIRSIQYTKDIAFDNTDPHYPNNGVATLAKTMTGVWALLDYLHFAGGRVDVVAHIMGGLVARALAGNQHYTQWLRGRDVNQATAIHQIITIDTPENGTNLATFLFLNQGLTFENLDDDAVLVVWMKACGLLFPWQVRTKTVQECFAHMGMNITGGPVKSLVPTSSSLQHIPGPAAPKWTWNAISSVVPQRIGPGESALQFEIEALIAALYPHASDAPKISRILGDNGKDDAVVPLASQNPVGAAQFHTFPGLAHIPAPKINLPIELLTNLDNHNVEQSQDIANLIACWLTKNGAGTCNPRAAPVAQAKAQFPASKRVPDVSAINGQQIAILMPPIIQLAMPFDAAITKPGARLTEVAVYQQDEKGHHAKQEKLAISRAAGDTAYVRVIPMLLGSVTFRFEAVFADGSVSSRDLTVPVGIPSLAPRQFRGDQFPEFSLSLQKGAMSRLSSPKPTTPRSRIGSMSGGNRIRSPLISAGVSTTKSSLSARPQLCS